MKLKQTWSCSQQAPWILQEFHVKYHPLHAREGTHLKAALKVKGTCIFLKSQTSQTNNFTSQTMALFFFNLCSRAWFFQLESITYWFYFLSMCSNCMTCTQICRCLHRFLVLQLLPFSSRSSCVCALAEYLLSDFNSVLEHCVQPCWQNSPTSRILGVVLTSEMTSTLLQQHVAFKLG